jgi:hypothetical protein
MKLANRTNLNSQHLRAIILRVAEIEQLSAADRQRVCITVKYGRHSNYREDTMSRVFAYYNKWATVLRVVEGILPDKKVLAKNIAWAFAANQNANTSASDKHYGWGSGWQQEWAWADAMPLGFEASEVKPEPAKDEKILAEMKHCVRRIQEWERKAKLAKTKQKVWQKKFNYYERRLKEGRVTVER